MYIFAAMKLKNRLFKEREMPIYLALIPLAVLIVMLAFVIKVFGSDAIAGGSQIALMVASSIAALLSITVCGCKWSTCKNCFKPLFTIPWTYDK